MSINLSPRETAGSGRFASDIQLEIIKKRRDGLSNSKAINVSYFSLETGLSFLNRNDRPATFSRWQFVSFDVVDTPSNIYLLYTAIGPTSPC